MYLFSNRRTVSVKYKFSRGIHLSAHRYYCPPQHVSPPVFTFNLNQFKAFLVADEVHCLDELVKEATCKHPMNPRDISAQRPGQDRAPVPCPSGEQIPEEIRKRHEQARQFLEAKEKGEQLKAARAGGNKDSIANHTPTDPTVVVVAVEPSKTTTVPRSGKAPLATKDPHLTTKNVASSNVSSTVTSDKKYACPVCGKGFRLSMALEHHMVTKHESSSGAVSSAMANVKTTPAPSPVDVKPAPKASPSEAKDVPVSASQPHVSPTSSVAPPINALSTLIDELLSAWDTVGLQRLPHTFKVWKLLDQETIMKHGHALRAQVVAEKEQEKRQHTSSAPRCGISVEYTPANLSIATGESIPIDFNPFEVLQAAASSSASLSTGGAPRPDETFNPFASLAQMTSEEGTSIPLGMSPLGGGGGVFDASFDQSEAAKVGGGESLSMSTLSEIMPGTEEKRHACNICGKAFKTRDGLAGHYEVKHPGQKLGMTTAQSSDAQSDGKHTIGVSLESIPAYVPTPVDLSKIPGQGTSEADARAVMAAEDMRNNIPNLDMDLVIHARAHTNITLSGTVLDVTTGYDHQLLVTQFGVLVDCGHSEGPQTVTVRIYGERTVKAVREWLRDGALILVSGLLRMNPQPDTTNSSGKYFNNPYVLISDQRGAIIPLWG